MKKKHHTKRKAPASVKRNDIPEINSWVTPDTEAKYWAALIGQVQGVVRTTSDGPIIRVRFAYNVKGRKLERPETMDFPASKLRLVEDFSARVIRENPRIAHTPPDDYEEIEAPDPTESDEFKTWFSGSLAVDSAGKPLELMELPADLYPSFQVATDKTCMFKEGTPTALVCLNYKKSKRIMVGPGFTAHDIPEHYWEEAKAAGFDMLIIYNPAKSAHIYVGELNSRILS